MCEPEHRQWLDDAEFYLTLALLVLTVVMMIEAVATWGESVRPHALCSVLTALSTPDTIEEFVDQLVKRKWL